MNEHIPCCGEDQFDDKQGSLKDGNGGVSHEIDSMALLLVILANMVYEDWTIKEDPHCEISKNKRSDHGDIGWIRAGRAW